MVVHSEEEAYKLYNDYAIRIGFSVRKEKLRYTKNGVRQREYVRSKEGFPRDGDHLDDKKFKRLQTRTGCEASIRFTVTNGEWKVTHFNSNHNHELAKPEERPFLRSNRKIADAQLDCYNTVNKQKLINVEAGDAQSLVNHFKQKQAEDPMFFYAIQVDQENRMTNFFWRDGRSRIDYNSFGDVICFDTTYRTNKYNMICAPFVGVNHHWKNVLFGCAFLLDETTASFTWLFETFMESMGNQKPKTIFTDQCQAMKNAIRVVLPDTCHRLCLWHISKNAAENLPRHYGNPEFKSRFNKILYNCETKIEFQSCWDALLRDYNLVGNKWLSTLYENRERWCSVFSHNIFSCRMKASSRSESTNNVFQHMASKTMRLTEFVHEYEKASKNMRTEELEEDFRCKQGTSFQIVQNCGLLQHASSVYTRTMFKRFELEITSTLGVTHQDVNSDGVSFTYEVIEGGGRRVHVVHFNSSNNEITCSCKMFETLGLLCRHALRILIVKNVTELPVQYILKRWTKNAKKDNVVCDHTKSADANDEASVTSRRNELMRLVYEFFTRSAATTRHTEMCKRKIREMIEFVEKDMEMLSVARDDGERENSFVDNNVSGDVEKTNCSLNNLPILDPPCVRPKGVTNARMKSNLEKRKRKALKDITRSSNSFSF
ncbi:hypothetical protein RGQ29_010777 [Quercus rubra]|uniref:SWIM-type domain-containing protein n=1 Tax=Quercus rubra TaxID=3512 RepID=A0AAN7G4I9_QUERU|nr:hypothetical protein RGQ29_010777 [Quercus rubra]